MSAELKPSEVLEKAAALIEPEGAWTQGVYARTKRGHPVGPLTQAATCWCMYGAVDRALGDDDDQFVPLRNACDDHMRRAVQDAPALFNDAPQRTQAEVVAALRKAAELARSEGQ